MPSLCLETDVCVDFVRGRVALASVAARHLPGAITWISSITLAELEYGVARSQSGAARVSLSRLLEMTTVRPFDVRAAAVYGGVRHRLESAGFPVGSLDTLIGAHALAEGAVLVTRNVREFSRIDGLALIDAAARD